MSEFGRPLSLTQSVADQICTRLGNGESLRKICGDPGMPDITTVVRWTHRNEDFHQQYMQAREVQAVHYADEVIEIADDVRKNATSEEIQGARLAVDARKWAASKLAPKRYGDKVIHSGDPENPMLQVTQINLVPVMPRRIEG